MDPLIMTSIDEIFSSIDLQDADLLELTTGVSTAVSEAQAIVSQASNSDSFFMGPNISQIPDAFPDGFPRTESTGQTIETFAEGLDPPRSSNDLPSYISLGTPPVPKVANGSIGGAHMVTSSGVKPAHMDVLYGREGGQDMALTSPSQQQPLSTSSSVSPCLSPQVDSDHSHPLHSPTTPQQNGFFSGPPPQPHMQDMGPGSSPMQVGPTTAGVGFHGLGVGNSPEMPTSTMEERKRTRNTGIAEMKLAGRRCQVCDDAASGFHYGVWSCEGCKAFFKRSLQGPNEYVCPATNNCTIDRSRRKSCQACRLRKCYEMGMSRGNCRERRAPNQPKPKPASKRRASENLELGPSEIKKEILDPAFNLSEPDDDSLLAPDSALPLPMHPLVDHLMRMDPPIRFCNHDQSLPDNQLNLMTSLFKLAEFELVDVITWAKNVPGYSGLSLAVRIHMLEASWMEVLILGLLWRSMQEDDKLVFAPDLHFDRKRIQITGCDHTCFPLLKLVKLFQKLEVTREEMVLLRVSLLLNADVLSEEEQNKVAVLQNAVEEAMEYTVVRRGKKPMRHIQRLLLILPHIRHVSLNAVAHIHDLKQEASVPMMDLLKEMMEGRNIVPPASARNSPQSESSP